MLLEANKNFVLIVGRGWNEGYDKYSIWRNGSAYFRATFKADIPVKVARSFIDNPNYFRKKKKEKNSLQVFPFYYSFFFLQIELITTGYA